jgi:hypothetical protein
MPTNVSTLQVVEAATAALEVKTEAKTNSNSLQIQKHLVELQDVKIHLVPFLAFAHPDMRIITASMSVFRRPLDVVRLLVHLAAIPWARLDSIVDVREAIR